MTTYRVDSDQMIAATSAVRGSMSRIQSEVAGLMGQLNGLQGSWSGQAATSFQGVVAQWRGTQQQVEESLAALNQALGQAGQHYAEVELTNAKLFSV
ncbi:WXG100 family type VII secretion target [Planctomonas sp. JC2975]|uniref:WXG100 family type VII secretion target n=1 Tax=Planctomonas sp. JC2975 TaxID=2729626 RepID=UPI001472C325|nr:WXG100 family type VII secretion target [Planctomonas sp. JC2975]NNC11657.1 WXG100 family type VII secretion target [Planctomonas sp. JC2975]